MHAYDDVAGLAALRPPARSATERPAIERLGSQQREVLRLQRLAGNSAVSSVLADEERSPVLDVVGRGGGHSLDQPAQAEMESRLGADFSGVRVHTDAAAAASAASVQARAYTVGDEIVFGSGAYDPASPAGQHTLAHELTHVLQQRAGDVEGTPTGDGIKISDPSDRYERAAEASATRALGGDSSRPAAGAVQRQDDEELAEPEEEIIQPVAVSRCAYDETGTVPQPDSE